MFDLSICIFSEEYKGEMPDDLLNEGWYRSGSCMSLVNNVELATGKTHVVRYDLEGLNYSRSARRILQQNKHFDIQFGPAVVDDELEALYAIYKSSINFRHAKSIDTFLWYTADPDAFDTELVTVRDGEKLIAAGYFDQGKSSTAAILNFFHPDYRKLSPGKHLMLQQMERTKALGKRFFYPGYIIEGDPKMNYKLFAAPDQVQVYYFWKEQWTAIDGSCDIFEKEHDDSSEDDQTIVRSHLRSVFQSYYPDAHIL